MNKRNEKRAGYKETKAGWIPEDWKCVRLDSICKVKTGPFGAQLHKSDYVDAGTPIVTVEHLGCRGLVHENLPLVSDNDKQRLSQYILKEGDIVFSRVGSVDRNSLVTSVEDGWLFSGRLLRVRKRHKKIDSRFLSYYFNQTGFKNYMYRIAVGGIMPSLNTSLLSGVPVSLPPLPKQRKIAEILSAWDNAIELVDRQIEAAKQLKEGLMQQLLTGKMRFPGFVGEWKEAKLGELFSERNENNPSLELLSITGDEGVIPRDAVGRKDTSNADKSKYKVIMPGDIGYNTMRMWQGRSAVSGLHGIVSPAYTIVTPKKNQDVEFYGYLFMLPIIIHLFYRYSQGLVSDTWSLKFPHFSQIKICVPKYEEQKRIAKVFLDLDQEMEKLSKMIAALKKQKQGMMQKLLTGEVRVKV